MSYKKSIHNLSKEILKYDGSFLITGATGLIGSCIIDVLIEANRNGAHYRIYAMSRSEERIKKRFSDDVIPVVHDVEEPIESEIKYDYIIHCASNADPKSYANFPVETILTNILGSRNILDYCRKHSNTRMLLTSTFEIYGSIDGVSV